MRKDCAHTTHPHKRFAKASNFDACAKATLATVRSHSVAKMPPSARYRDRCTFATMMVTGAARE
eukprot:3052770-Pleurochrysis_carterae.AAC.3